MGIFQKIIVYSGIGLFVFLLARLGILLIHHEYFGSLTFGEILVGFFYGLRFDLASLFVFLGIPLLIMALPFRWMQYKWLHLALSLIVFFLLAVQSTILVADVTYFGYVKRHLTNELLFLVKDINYLIKEVAANPTYFTAWLVLFIMAVYYWLRLALFPMRPVSWHLFKFTLFFLFVIIAGRGGIGMKPLAIVHAYSSGSSSFGNLVLNGVFSASQSSLTAPVARKSISKEQIKETLNLPEDFWEKQYPLSRNNKPHLNQKYNLVVLFVESLTPRYIDSFGGNNYQITANLDKISLEGWKFNRFYSHGQRSIDGLQSVLVGLPSILGLPAISHLSVNYSKIAAIAEQNGVSTIFVNSTLRESFMFEAIAGSVGFSEYYGKEDMPLLLDYHPDEKDRNLGWDYETLMFSLGKINKIDNQFLLFISLNTDHTPFPKMKAPFNRHNHNATGEGGYLNALHYTDWAIGEFMAKSQKEEWFSNTIFAVTSDHVLGHFQNGNFLQRFRIPLIFFAPEILKPKEIETVSSQLDLMPTFIDFMGLETEYTALGTSLLRNKESFALVREGSLVGIITDRGYLKHSLIHRMEFGKLHAGTNDNYFDLLEDNLLAWDIVAYELVSNNRWSP